MKDKLLPSEVLFLFGAELTSLEKPITLSSKHNAAIMAEMILAFCKKYNLEEPRENWHKLKLN